MQLACFLTEPLNNSPQSDLWKWRNDRRSEPNLCNCVKKPEKKKKFRLYQLSYEATDVGSRSIVGSYVPVKEMSVNDIWNKSYDELRKWNENEEMIVAVNAVYAIA